MEIREKYARLKFSQIKGYGFSQFTEILRKYNSIYDFFTRNNSSYDNLKHFPNNHIDLSENFPEKFVVIGEENYPKLLENTPYPPIVLFYRGDIALCNSEKLISIVGTRNHSNYGKRVTYELVEKLGKYKYTFVSGMALGVDTLVHKFSLKNGFKTIAVIPSSLDKPSPISNIKLFEEIAQEGLVISETLDNFLWNKSVYAKRNRIIAGLSPKTIVVEAPRKSGALITANLAFEYNREVYAVPGNLGSIYSEGTNLLIKNLKAQLYSSVDDIIPGQYEIDSREGDDEIINLLKVEPLDIEQICAVLGLGINDVKNRILELEIRGMICLNSDAKYNIKSF